MKPIKTIEIKIQSVNCIFKLYPFSEGRFHWYMIASRRRKRVVGRKIQMVTLEVHGNSLHGQAERYDTLMKGELPRYEWFEHVFNDFCLGTTKQMREFL